MSLTARITAAIEAALLNPLDLATPQDTLRFKDTTQLADGVGDNQANQSWHDQRTLVASATEDLDLSGALTNAFGLTLTFTAVKALLVRAADSNTNNVLVGGAASAQFDTWVGDASDIVVIPPGGLFLLTAPVDGFAVTGTTADLLRVANSGAGTSVTYDIILIGVHA